MHSTLQQIIFLRQVRARLGSDIHFAEELAETLHISTDSAYRRMRGQTAMTFQEVALLSRKYNLSVDALLGQQLDMVGFQFTPLKASIPGFHEYLRNIQEQLLSMQDIESSELYFAGSDLPIFHYFPYPDLTAFKIYFWLRIYTQAPDVRERHFERSIIPEELINRARQAYQAYLPMHSFEVIHTRALEVSLHQFSWCLSHNLIKRRGEAERILHQLARLGEGLRVQADRGVKEDPDSQIHEGGNISLYANNFHLGDNIMLMRQGDRIISHLNQNMLQIMLTTHETFGANCLSYVQNIMLAESRVEQDSPFFEELARLITEMQKCIASHPFELD